MINWKKIIKNEKKKKYFIKMKYLLENEYKYKKIYPPKKNIFEAFKITKFKNIKVVIIGQDPYCNKNQSHGLAFSLLPNIKKITSSLINIYKEIKNEYHEFKIPKNGYLLNWAKQGILLLNSILTVESKKILSHKNIGWEIFTDNIIRYINKYRTNIVFLLWGKFAQKKKKLINKNKHLILISSHPSKFSFKKGFLNCNHFKKTNIFLIKNKKKPILW